MHSRGALWSLPLLTAIALFASTARAQQEEPKPQGPLTTLHVYMDLIQVPVLVLDPWLGPMKPVDPSHFLVSLDSGPTFHPKHVRPQGEDSITLGVLLDTSGDAAYLMREMDTALASLAPDWLHEKDHVTVLSLECGVVRRLPEVPANPVQIKLAVDHALDPWRARNKAACPKGRSLWDAMAHGVQALGSLPGRRVLLVVTDGVDRGSSTRWNDLREFAQDRGVAVFGMVPGPGGPGTAFHSVYPTLISLGPEDPFDGICQLSGGLRMRVDHEMRHPLQRFVTMLRERYIVEFARARNETPGRHSIDVTLANKLAYVRPAGVSVFEGSGRDDANTIPRDTTGAPEMGKRRVLAPH